MTKDIKAVQEQDLDTAVSEPCGSDDVESKEDSKEEEDWTNENKLAEGFSDEEEVEEDELLVTSDSEEAGPPFKCLKGMQKSARSRASAAAAKKPKSTPLSAKWTPKYIGIK
uniref:Uncharacterized protein n=1 Tax=Moniliophthora roreri TaxID=221103 RepID=A0A0W0FAX8_MONRR